jgi:hypothetical protein
MATMAAVTDSGAHLIPGGVRAFVYTNDTKFATRAILFTSSADCGLPMCSDVSGYRLHVNTECSALVLQRIEANYCLHGLHFRDCFLRRCIFPREEFGL